MRTARVAEEAPPGWSEGGNMRTEGAAEARYVEELRRQLEQVRVSVRVGVRVRVRFRVGLRLSPSPRPNPNQGALQTAEARQEVASQTAALLGYRRLVGERDEQRRELEERHKAQRHDPNRSPNPHANPDTSPSPSPDPNPMRPTACGPFKPHK